MGLILPTVYPITDRRISGLSHAEQVRRLILGGATFIQLRDKDASPRDFYRQAVDALEIARKHNVKIIINDRVDLALALRADGVHLGQTDLPPEAARRLLGQAAIIGFSTHYAAQTLMATNLPVNYIAFGPIFKTSTKEKPDPVAGLAALQQARKATGAVPLVAIGGINGTNAKAVLGAGADSLAMISELLDPADGIEENMRKLLTIA